MQKQLVLQANCNNTQKQPSSSENSTCSINTAISENHKFEEGSSALIRHSLAPQHVPFFIYAFLLVQLSNHFKIRKFIFPPKTPEDNTLKIYYPCNNQPGHCPANQRTFELDSLTTN